jgi:hypothetical protein
VKPLASGGGAAVALSMSAMSQPTLQLRPALRRPVRRRDLAVATTVLFASAAGGATMALLQPAQAARSQPAPLVLPLPVPALVSAPAIAPVAQPPLDLAPVIEDGGLRVVLDTDVEPQWIAADIQVRDHDGVRVVTRALSDRGREHFGRFVGSRLRLLAKDETSCTAEITGLAALGRFAPDDFGEAEHPVSAQAAWDAADGSYLVAGDLRVIDGDCSGALWAEPAARAAPVAADIGDASPELTRRAITMLRGEDGFLDATAGTEPTFEVDSVSLDGGETVLVASVLVEGCVEREPVLTALYALQADGSLHRVGAPARVVSIDAAADIDGDGHIELLVHGDSLDVSILRRRTGAYLQEAHTLVPIYGCRC